jgi:Tol biopolymer transport system component/DNA-binding winged helix-turn-helix (wHTH) protein
MATAFVTKSFVFRFADVTVREREFAIAKAGKAQQVEPKAFQVLLILIRNPNQLIAKEELLNSVWGETAVTENSLARNIALLRRILGDDPRSPRFIETVSSIGYRFICPVELTEEYPEMAVPAWDLNAVDPGDNGSLPRPYEDKFTPDVEPHTGTNEGQPLQQRNLKTNWVLLSGCGVLVIAAAAGVWRLHRPLPSPRITEYKKLTHDGHQKFPGGTDGSRVYFTDFAGSPISQVAVSGGEIAPVPVPLTYVSHLESVSQDGSSLIVDTDEKGIIFDRPQWMVGTLGGSVRRLPDGTGATFSPDGQSVIYATSHGGIWLVQSNGTGAHQVATVEGAGADFAWSPNGTKIRFSKENRLWEMSSNGSNLHPLLSAQHLPGGQCCGHWTADGKFFLFRSGDLGTGDTGIWAIDERRRLFLQPQPEPVQLTNGPIRWSSLVAGKDAKKIYAEGETPRGELSRFDAQTKHFLPFLGGISAGCVAFSKDGQSVAYVLYPEGTLWKANRDGSNPVRLSDPPINAHSPRWSPDGKQIVFTDLSNVTSLVLNNRLSEVYVVSAEGGSPQRLLPDDNGSEGDPTWSPDGRRVAYGWSGSAKFGATPEIRILDLDSRQISTVPGSVGIGSPRWSPDGRYIAGIGNRSLHLFDMEKQRWSTLVEKPLGYNQWSQDSRWIYFLADGDVERVSVKGGTTERVAALGNWLITGWWGWMGLDATDAPMVLHGVGNDDIYVLSLDEK